MIIKRNQSLQYHHTFRVKVLAEYFVEIFSIADFLDVISNENLLKIPRLILGEGSNVLFTNNFNGLVIKNSITGIEISEENEDFVIITAKSGVKWHDLVQYCVERNYCGLENLSLIPGTVGAAPIQNIGAYGVEQKDDFFSLEAVDIENKTIKSFTKEECKFDYRNSVFKNELKGKFFISSVSYKLSRNFKPNIVYQEIKKLIEDKKISTLTPKTISGLIIDIREKKLPDLEKLGNAGSFFKNPIVSGTKYKELLEVFPEIKGTFVGSKEMKLSAAWLIDQCGWKGKKKNNAGVYEKHALILVNHGNASGTDICKLADQIRKSVKLKFEVDLEPEVNII